MINRAIHIQRVEISNSEAMVPHKNIKLRNRTSRNASADTLYNVMARIFDRYGVLKSYH